jgi:ankyrin repeat protein
MRWLRYSCAQAQAFRTTNKRGDTPLLVVVESGKLEIAEKLVSKGANVETVRMDGAGLLALVIVSQ